MELKYLNTMHFIPEYFNLTIHILIERETFFFHMLKEILYYNRIKK